MSKKELRSRIFNKFNGKCSYCGIDLPKRWHIDHLLPLVRNSDGSMEYPERDTESNMMPSCPTCNKDKSSMSLENWRIMLHNKIEVLNRDVSAFRMAKKYGLVIETGRKIEFYFEEHERLSALFDFK